LLKRVSSVAVWHTTASASIIFECRKVAKNPVRSNALEINVGKYFFAIHTTAPVHTIVQVVCSIGLPSREPPPPPYGSPSLPAVIAIVPARAPKFLIPAMLRHGPPGRILAGVPHR
jgi:hypothetical protein